MSFKAPGKAHREGLSLIEVMDMFPSEDAAREWVESTIWPNGRCCGKCGSTNTHEATHKTMPYRCRDCRSYFSVKTGTPLASSNIPLRKWAIAIYLCLTSLKSVSSMKLHRDLGISQKSAWFMLHRIREAWMPKGGETSYAGPAGSSPGSWGARSATAGWSPTTGWTPVLARSGRNRARANVSGVAPAKSTFGSSLG